MSVSEHGRVALVSMHTSPVDPPGRGDAGGMNVHLSELSAALVTQGWEVDLLTRRVDPDSPTVQELPSGARLLTLTAGPPDAVVKHQLSRMVGEFAGAAGEFARRRRYDIVHSHYWLSGVAGLAIAAAVGAPHVLNLHTVAAMKNATLAPGDSPEPVERLRWEADLVAGSAMTIAGTRAEAAAVQSEYGGDPERIRVIPPGVDLLAFSPRRSGAAIDSCADPQTRDVLRHGGYLAMVARLQPLKGHDTAVLALAAMPAALRRPLVLAGDTSPGHDEFRDRLHALVLEHRVEDLVHFLPAQSRAATADLLAGAKLLLAPSRSETFGLITLEAAASGTPVVAACVNGLAEAVADGRSGILIDGFDPLLWAREIGGLLADPVALRALGESARDYASAFGWPAVGAATIEIYRSLA